MEDNNLPYDAADEASFTDMFGEGVEQTIEDFSAPGGATPASRPQTPGSSPENQADADDDVPDEPSGAQAQPEASDDPDAGDAAADTPRDNPDRYEYWQSRADKTQAELEKYKNQVEAQTPLLRYISENPDLAQQVYSTVQSHLSADKGSSNDGVASSQSLPERPQKPEKPSHYDPVDAVSATDSESFRYRVALEDYQEKLVEYNEALVRSQDEQLSEQKKTQTQNQQRQQQAQQLYQEAMYRYKMEPAKAAEFVRWAFKPNYSVEDLVAVYNAQQKQQGAAAQKASMATRKKQQLESPPPPAKQGNSVKKQVSEINEEDPHQMGEAFVDSLFDNLGMG